MPYDPKCGDALLIPSGPANDPDRKHLHGLLTHRCEDEFHLLTCIESIIEGAFHDDACELNPGDHPFIKKPSYVNYRRLATMKAGRLALMVDGWVYLLKEPLSSDLLARICMGIETSRFAPRKMKQYYVAQKEKLLAARVAPPNEVAAQ